MSNINPNDEGLMKIEYGIAAVERTQVILEKLWSKYRGKKALPSHLPLTVPHTIYSGPGGTGKTRRVEAAIKSMGCSEKDGTYVKLSPDAIRTPDALVDILMRSLSWKGYLSKDGRVDHKIGEWPDLVDPKRPVAPTQQIAVFIDEIHDLDKAVLNAMLLILYEWEYQFTNKRGEFQHLRFPKFTLFAATTDIGELPAPLQTRFGNKIELDYYSDDEMTEIIKVMAKGSNLTIDDKAAEILGMCAQGVPRLGENHVRGVYEALCYYQNKEVEWLDNNADRHIPLQLVLKYIHTSKHLPDGMRHSQILALNFLYERGEKNGRRLPAGEQAICDSLGVDKKNYKMSIEPRLLARGLIERGGRGRSITEEGIIYLNRVKETFPSVFKQ